MNPVDQTRVGIYGNCMLACLASILEMDIDELPDIYAAHYQGRDWPNVINTYLVRHHALFYVETQEVYSQFIVPAWETGFHLVNGPSPRNHKDGHSCVGRAGRILFDPHPDRAGLTSIRYVRTAHSRVGMARRALQIERVRVPHMQAAPMSMLCLACKKNPTDGGLQCASCRSRDIDSGEINGLKVQEKGKAKPHEAGREHGLQVRRQRQATDGEAGGSVAGGEAPRSLKLTFPWSCLASDNLRKGIIGAESRASQARYAATLARFRAKAEELYSGPPIGPAAVDALFFVPDRRARDGGNFLKLVGDGLKGIVIIDDKFEELPHICVDYGGVDCDAPRCEILVRRFEECIARPTLSLDCQ